MKKNVLSVIAANLLVWNFIFSLVSVQSQDIVSSEDISGGSSVFVFRESSKAPQAKAAMSARIGKRSTAQRTETRRKVRTQIDTVAKVTPTRRRAQKVDPTLVAIDGSQRGTRDPKTPGVKATPATNVASKEKASEALAGAAEVYLDKNETDKAIDYFKEAISLNPKNETAKLGLSDAYVQKGDETSEKDNPASSIFFYEQATQLNPNNAAAYAGLAQSFDEMEQNAKALPNYEKALQLNPALTELYAPAGALYYDKGEIALAERYLTKAVASRPNDPDTQFYLGLVRYKQNRNEEAIAAFRQAIALNPNYSEAHYFLGEVYDRANRNNDAVAEYKEAVRINPKYVDAWFDLGAASYNGGRYEDSIAAYKEAIRLKNDYGEAHKNLADVYRQMATKSKIPAKRNEYFGLANGEYSIAAAFIKNDADLYSSWGYCLGRTARWSSAIDTLNKAVSISPDAFDYTNLGWAYYNSAQNDLAENKKPEAQTKLQLGKSALEKAVALNDKFGAAFLNLGITYTDLGDFNAAVTALKAATNLRKNWVSAINELGIAYRKLNNFDDAATQFRRATEIDQKFASGLYNLGESEFRRGNTKEARKAQDRLRKLNPNLANQLEVIFSGAVLTQPKAEIENKVNEKNPGNKLPTKLPKPKFPN